MTVLGTLFKCTGTIGGRGVFGNHYEPVATNVIFDEWESGVPGELFLGEIQWGKELQPVRQEKFPYGFEKMPCICFHRFYLVHDVEHNHWGFFIPNETKVSCVELAIRNPLNQFGERPVIEEDPTSYSYEPVQFAGQSGIDHHRIRRKPKSE